MEQKQLDEVEESLLTEEFIDEDDFLEEVKAETKSKRGKKSVKKASKEEAKVEEIKITPIKEEVIEPEVAMSPVKEEKKPVETSAPPVDPWGEEKEKPTEIVASRSEDNSSGIFKEASTWKAITGIAIILLLFSVFTQGFHFSEEAVVSSPTGAVVSLQDAEQKALMYFNENLVREPFTAELISSTEENDLYKITFSIAGQVIDSYMTKDGKMFFPQGFDTSISLLDSNAAPPNEDLGDIEPIEVVGVEEEMEETPAEVGVKIIPLNAKKWLFAPNKLTVKKGTVVQFVINPQELEFTFAIPALNIEQEVSGTTNVEFTASESGTFEFVCSSCEDWRGMKGTLTVE